MGYKVKVQKIERKTNPSYYVNFPFAIAEAANIGKGEEFEWIIEDCNTMVFRRLNPIDRPHSEKLDDEQGGK